MLHYQSVKPGKVDHVKTYTEAATWGILLRGMFSKISEISLENACVGVSF